MFPQAWCHFILLYFDRVPLVKYLALILTVASSCEEHAIHRTFTPYCETSPGV
jgi:hypothetical protein